MPRWSHPKKQLRDALAEADAAGFHVKDTSAHGHRWGYIQCPSCAQKFSVWSTPRNADNHVKQIRHFIRRHNHEEG